MEKDGREESGARALHDFWKLQLRSRSNKIWCSPDNWSSPCQRQRRGGDMDDTWWTADEGRRWVATSYRRPSWQTWSSKKSTKARERGTWKELATHRSRYRSYTTQSRARLNEELEARATSKNSVDLPVTDQASSGSTTRFTNRTKRERAVTQREDCKFLIHVFGLIWLHPGWHGRVAAFRNIWILYPRTGATRQTDFRQRHERNTTAGKVKRIKKARNSPCRWCRPSRWTWWYRQRRSDACHGRWSGRAARTARLGRRQLDDARLAGFDGDYLLAGTDDALVRLSTFSFSSSN